MILTVFVFLFLVLSSIILIGEWPNTYAFTKALAEDLVRHEGKGLPIGVHRPSIVISTYREPLRAWINNVYGPSGLAAGAGLGLLRILPIDGTVNANLVPADMVVNSIIACGWEIGTTYAKAVAEKRSYDIPIYNFESSTDNPITWGSYISYSFNGELKTPTNKSVWYASLLLMKSHIGYLIGALFLHRLPALIVDGVLICIGRKPSIVKFYKKIQKFLEAISYFTARSFKFESHRIRNLIESMSGRDKELFFCDLKKLEWPEYLETYASGIRVFVIGDPMDTLKEAKIRRKRLYWAHQLVKLIGAIILMRIFWAILSAFI